MDPGPGSLFLVGALAFTVAVFAALAVIVIRHLMCRGSRPIERPPG